MDRRVHILADDPLGDEDRVLEVVALPRHEGDEDVLPEGELAALGRRTVGDHVAALDPVADADDRLLVEAGVLVRTLELDQVVDVGLGPEDAAAVALLAGDRLDDDTRAVDLLDDAVAERDHGRAGVTGDVGLDPGADQRRCGAQAGDRLSLHVRAHQRPVGVVVLEEGDERGGDRDQLARGDVHQRQLLVGDHLELVVVATPDLVRHHLAVVVDLRVRLGDVVTGLLEGAVVGDLGGGDTTVDRAVRGLDEPVLVDPGVGRERGDEADVRTLRRLDRTDTTVVRRVDVADLETSPLPGETARSQGAEATLVGHLAERVGLVHELAELRGGEVLLDHRRDRLGVDQVRRHERVHLLGHAHALLDGALHPDQTDAVLVLHQLTDRADAAVAEVVDVVRLTAPVAELDQVADRLHDVAVGQRLLAQLLVDAELVVQLETADRRQVVALGLEEERLEERTRGLQGRRIAGAEAAVDLQQRLLGGLQLVRDQGVAEEGADVEVVDVEDLKRLDLRLAEADDVLLSDVIVAVEEDLAGHLVDDILGGDLPHEILDLEGQTLDPRLAHALDVPLGELAPLLDEDVVSLGVADVLRRSLTAEQVEVDRPHDRLALEEDLLAVVVVVEQALGRVAEGAQEHGRVELASAIDADEEQVLVVELEVEPRSAVRDHAGVEELLARRVGLALVVVEEDAGGAVKLGDDDALGAVDDEGPVLSHQRDLTEVDLLLLDVADRLGPSLIVDVPDDQADDHLDRRGEGTPTSATLVGVVLGAVKAVGDELEGRGLAEILDREDAVEDRLKTDLVALFVRDASLEELVVRTLLDVDQVRDVDDPLELPEVLTHPEVVLDDVCHQFSST